MAHLPESTEPTEPEVVYGEFDGDYFRAMAIDHALGFYFVWIRQMRERREQQVVDRVLDPDLFTDGTALFETALASFGYKIVPDDDDADDSSPFPD